MRKYVFVAAIALLGTLGLAACGGSEQAGQASSKAAATRPADPTDIQAWGNYLGGIVQNNMGNITTTPFVYFVPASDNPAEAGTLARVQDQLNLVVASTVLPGNMVAVGGPSSATTAHALETAFATAGPGSFKGVVVLFIGDAADEAAVKSALAASGATVKFAQM